MREIFMALRQLQAGIPGQNCGKKSDLMVERKRSVRDARKNVLPGDRISTLCYHIRGKKQRSFSSSPPFYSAKKVVKPLIFPHFQQGFQQDLWRRGWKEWKTPYYNGYNPPLPSWNNRQKQ
ncbi:hypothetical protein [Angelakisella massiliensis]|uniref:hypothetical protein n=1 Tax=Angelakisella massiliensis TaxID=1871018 RepID=UPI00111340F9|nr:hypothetical protein [Angelakisella massiliensis]